MLQDIAPHHFNNQYLPVKADENSIVMVYHEGKILCLINEEDIIFPMYQKGYQYEYLFTIDDLRYFFIVNKDRSFIESYLEKGYSYHGMRDLSFHDQQWKAFAGITACQMIRFYTTRSYCGKCGHKMIRSKTERRMDCPNCHQMEFPKICPAVIVGIIDQDRILLSQYNGGKMYALIAGYAETGETIEETVKREVKEETDLNVTNLHYYKSQPWSMSDTLLFGFYCEVEGNHKITVDHSELSTAFFASREDIPDYLDQGSLTAEMIMNFKKHGRKVLE